MYSTEGGGLERGEEGRKGICMKRGMERRKLERIDISRTFDFSKRSS